jgi:hypothetical protein
MQATIRFPASFVRWRAPRRVPRLLAERADQRLHPFDRRRRTCGENVKLALRRHLRPTEHGRRHIVDAAPRMLRSHQPGAIDRGGRHVDVNLRRRRFLGQHAAVEEHAAHSFIVGQHRQHGIAAKHFLGVRRRNPPAAVARCIALFEVSQA